MRICILLPVLLAMLIGIGLAQRMDSLYKRAR